jgi:hypothetical protein
MIAFSLIEQTNVILSPQADKGITAATPGIAPRRGEESVDSSVVHLDSLRMGIMLKRSGGTLKLV